jgi:hypothetical protein
MPGGRSGASPMRPGRAGCTLTAEIGSEGRVMEIQEVVSGARDVVSVKRVYGDPYEKNGLTVIPAATVRGAGGGIGAADEEHGESKKSGFRMTARPSGAWIIEDGSATWKPAVDVNRIVLGGQMIAMTAILVVGGVLLAGSRRRHPLLELGSELRALRRLQRRVPDVRRYFGR